MRHRLKLIRVRCLGLKCPRGGWFMSDSPGHRFCPHCDGKRIQASRKYVEPCKVTEADVRLYQG